MAPSARSAAGMPLVKSGPLGLLSPLAIFALRSWPTACQIRCFSSPKIPAYVINLREACPVAARRARLLKPEAAGWAIHGFRAVRGTTRISGHGEAVRARYDDSAGARLGRGVRLFCRNQWSVSS